MRTILPRRRWSAETILIPLDWGRFVVVHPCSGFSDCCELATPQNAEVQKAAKFWVLVGDVRCGRYKSTKKPSFWRLHYLNWPNLITVGVNNTQNRLPLSALLYSYNRQQLMITMSTANVCRGTARRQRWTVEMTWDGSTSLARGQVKWSEVSRV